MVGRFWSGLLGTYTMTSYTIASFADGKDQRHGWPCRLSPNVFGGSVRSDRDALRYPLSLTQGLSLLTFPLRSAWRGGR